MQRTEALRIRWQRLFDAVGTSRERRVIFDALLVAYAEPHRHYHNLDHIAACLDQLNSVPTNIVRDGQAVALAIWFHDSVYDPRGHFNEKFSAEFADACLLRLKTSHVFRRPVRELILATDHRIAPRLGDAKLIVDIDLSNFGADRAAFDAYERAIREEYSYVPEEPYRFARANVLKRFLHRPRIYLTSHFYDRYEIGARANLSRSIRTLTSS